MAEGVGFEPTVGFPTLDFESSALNRTQPPFQFWIDNRAHTMGDDTILVNSTGLLTPRARRIQRTLRKLNAVVIRCGLCVRFLGGDSRPKNVTIFVLIRMRDALHIAFPPDGPRYYLLFTPVHRLLAPLFAVTDKLLTITPLPNHDSA